MVLLLVWLSTGAAVTLLMARMLKHLGDWAAKTAFKEYEYEKEHALAVAVALRSYDAPRELWESCGCAVTDPNASPALPAECLRDDDSLAATGCMCDGCKRRRDRMRRDEFDRYGRAARVQEDYRNYYGDLNDPNRSGALYWGGNPPTLGYTERALFGNILTNPRPDNPGGAVDRNCHADAHDRDSDSALRHADSPGAYEHACADVGPESAPDGACGPTDDSHGFVSAPDVGGDSYGPCDSGSDSGPCDSGGDSGGW